MSDDFDDNLLKAKERSKQGAYDESPETNLVSTGSKTGYEFLGTVISGGILGFAIDYFFETAPWGLMVCIVFGFVSATIRAQTAMNKKD